jgi:NAD+ synthase (glutamine-hydrolysing)
MRVALAQINSTLGDFVGNRKKILEYIHKADDRGADLVVFPEAALFGYHPVDLLERASIVEAQEKELEILAQEVPDNICALVGAITRNPRKKGKPYFNAAVLLRHGRPPKVFAKQLLPTYDVFDEGRHIEPGRVSDNSFTFKGKRIQVTICEDIWAWPLDGEGERYSQNPIRKLEKGSADLVVNLSASPFTEHKIPQRRKVVEKTAKHLGVPMVYVNMVGAQDELIYDGGSFAVDARGKRFAQSHRFQEDINIVNVESLDGGEREDNLSLSELRRQALVLGIRDFVEKVGFERVHLGLSGGIDSALVACLAVDALGPYRVTCIGLPGPHTSKESVLWSRQLVERLGTEWKEIDIKQSYTTTLKSLQKGLGDFPFGITNENIQSRLRGLMLMAFSNLHSSLLLNTSNKSELAVGYSTLYGDLTGGLCVIGDLLKREVFELSRYYNSEFELIPEGIISRPPSAELRPDQRDEDSLPPYDKLDILVDKIVEEYARPKGPLGKKVLSMMMASEFKRWQAPPILKVTDHAFGRGRRLPIAHKAKG